MTTFETPSDRDREIALEVGLSMASTWSDFPEQEAVETIAVGLAAWRAYSGEWHYRYIMTEAMIPHASLHETVADVAVDRLEQGWTLRADRESRAL